MAVDEEHQVDGEGDVAEEGEHQAAEDEGEAVVVPGVEDSVEEDLEEEGLEDVVDQEAAHQGDAEVSVADVVVDEAVSVVHNLYVCDACIFSHSSLSLALVDV